MKYCTYLRFMGIFGWFHGWFLVGIADEPRVSGYAADFMGIGCKLLVLEMTPPLPQRFRFIPKGAKKIQQVRIGVLDLPLPKR